MTRKRGVYYFRRRLPHPHFGEVTLSLGTRRYREAEYLAAAVASQFNNVTAKKMNSEDLKPILREYLKGLLARDRDRLLKTPYHRAALAEEPWDGLYGAEADQA